jgi:hypothetical protein
MDASSTVPTYIENELYYRTVHDDTHRIDCHLWLLVHRLSPTRIVRYDIFAATPYVDPPPPRLSYLHEKNADGAHPCWLLRGKHGVFSENSHVQTVTWAPTLGLKKCAVGEHIGQATQWVLSRDPTFYPPPKWLRPLLLSADPKYKAGYGVTPFGKKGKNPSLCFVRLDAYWLREYSIQSDSAARCIQHWCQEQKRVKGGDSLYSRCTTSVT